MQRWAIFRGGLAAFNKEADGKMCNYPLCKNLTNHNLEDSLARLYSTDLIAVSIAQLLFFAE